MSAIEKFFASLKRLLEPRTPPSVERIEQPTADRPPPQAAAMPSRVDAPPQVEAALSQSEAAPSLEPASRDVIPPDDDLVIPPDDELEEVRAALQAVSHVPEPIAAPALAPTPPVLFPAAIEEAVEAPVPPSDRVGDALVLTLGTPPVTFTVAKTSATLGRGQENTIRLDDLSVSRRHARIAYRQGGYWLSDLGSMGGTWVDGTRLIAPRRIAAGETIDIGLCRLTVSFAGGAAKAGTRQSASKPQSEIAGQARRRR